MNAPEDARPMMCIVAATDFSEAARAAADRAALLAMAHQASLTLTHVVSGGWADEVREWLHGSDWAERLHQQVLDALNAEAQRLHASQHVVVETALLEGHPVTTLARQPADLMVLGARGSNALHRLLVGTTTERLLSKSSAPLLVVRRTHPKAYQRVLVPLDFSAWSARAVQEARRIAPQASLVLMHSFTIPFEEKLRFAGVDDATLEHYREQARQKALANLKAIVGKHALPEDRYQLCLTEGDAPHHILQQAQARDCDLIVIGKHGRQVAEELLLGSVTRHVVDEALCDVLVSTARDQ